MNHKIHSKHANKNEVNNKVHINIVLNVSLKYLEGKITIEKYFRAYVTDTTSNP